MRLGTLILLTALTASATSQAEETLPTSTTAAAQPTTSAVAPSAQEFQLQTEVAEQKAQLQAVRKENEQLKQRLRQAEANSAPKPLITEEQTWYVVGAGGALLGVLIGALLRGGRRTRREWLN